MPRYLRPFRLLRSAGATWLVDESWSVVARLGDDGGVVLLSWPWWGASVDPDHRVVVADGVGIVVWSRGRVAWVRAEGTTVAEVDDEMRLAAADPDIAWLVDRSYVDPGDPPVPPPPLSPGRIVAVRRDGPPTEVPSPQPVYGIALRDEQLWVTLAELPVTHSDDGQSWHYEYPLSTLRLERNALLNDGLAAAVPATDAPEDDGYDPHGSWRLADDADTVLRMGVRAGGLVWDVGSDPAEGQIDGLLVAVGYHPATSEEAVRVELGRGIVRDVQTVGDELCVAAARRRFVAQPDDLGVEMLAVATSGAVRTVHEADSIDVSRFAPPRVRPPEEQIRDHVERVRHKFDHLASYWRGRDGTASPLSDGLTDPSVSVDGEWPDTRVVITLQHRSRPGLVLRRTLRLFGDDGSPEHHGYADVYLMEDLDTGYLAPGEEAVNGVLDT